MSCILRIGGKAVDIVALVSMAGLQPHQIWQKGEVRFASSGRPADSSGCLVEVSGAEFADFGRQVADAISFMRKHEDALRAIATFPGVEWSCMDFGVETDLSGPISYTFPPELVSLAGGVGVSLTVSVYPSALEGEE